MIYAWVYNINDPDAFSHFQDFQNNKDSPYKKINQEDYFKILKENNQNVLVFDTRSYGLFDGLNKAVLANKSQKKFDELIKDIKENFSSYKNKKIIFICHGGHHATNIQEEFGKKLAENKINIEHLSFNPGPMLQFVPSWMVQKVIYLPETMIDFWQEEGSIKVMKIDEETKKSLKETLPLFGIPVVITGNINPLTIEQSLYPLKGERYYTWNNFLSPPRWFGKIIFSLTKYLEYKTLLYFYLLFCLLILFALRLWEISKNENTSTFIIIRSLTGGLLLIITHYFSSCFFVNHINFNFQSNIYLPYYFLTMIISINLRLLYNERAMGVFLGDINKNNSMRLKLKQIIHWKRFLIVLFPVVYSIMFFIVQQWEPYRLLNRITFIFILLLIFYTPVFDLIILLLFKIRKIQSPFAIKVIEE